MNHRRAAPGRVIADLLFRFEHRHDARLRESSAAADRPAIPPPMTRISALLVTSGCGQALVHDLAVLGEANAFDDLVIVRKHRRSPLLVPERTQKIVEVAGKERRESAARLRARFAAPKIVTPCFTTRSPLTVPSTLPPRFRRQIHDHAAGPHCRDLRIADEPRGRLSGNQRSRDDDVLLGDVARTSSACAF